MQKLSLVNLVTREIASVFPEGAEEILVPDHPNVKPAVGLDVGPFRVVRVRPAEVPPQHEIFGQPLYVLGADDVVHERAQFVRVEG